MFTYNVTFHICTSHSNYIHRDTSFRKSVVTPISCDFLNVVGWWKEERFNLIHLHRTDLQLYEHIHLFSCVNILHWQIKQRTSIIIQTDRYASSIIQLCVENKLLLIHIGGKEHKQLHTCLSIHLYRIYNISLYIYIHLCISRKVSTHDSTWEVYMNTVMSHVIVAWTASTFCSFWKVPIESCRRQHSMGTKHLSGGLCPPEQRHEGLQGHIAQGPNLLAMIATITMGSWSSNSGVVDVEVLYI